MKTNYAKCSLSRNGCRIVIRQGEPYDRNDMVEEVIHKSNGQDFSVRYKFFNSPQAARNAVENWPSEEGLIDVVDPNDTLAYDES